MLQKLLDLAVDGLQLVACEDGSRKMDFEIEGLQKMLSEMEISAPVSVKIAGFLIKLWLFVKKEQEKTQKGEKGGRRGRHL